MLYCDSNFTEIYATHYLDDLKFLIKQKGSV